MSWMLPEAAFSWLEAHAGSLRGSPVIELGSGEGTPRLHRIFAPRTLFSVEHDPAWLGRFSPANYINAPLRDGWYDADILRIALPKDISAVIVDGPPGGEGRSGIYEHLGLFGDVPMLIDDTQRSSVLALAEAIAKKRGEALTLHEQPDGRSFATIGWA